MGCRAVPLPLFSLTTGRSREQAVLGAKGDKSLLTHLGRNPATIVNREGTQTLGKHSKYVSNALDVG